MTTTAPPILGEMPVVIKGAGEMASGVAVRLHRAGFRRLVMLEVPAPLAVRRAVSFSEAVYDGAMTVEGVTAVRVRDAAAFPEVWERNAIPLRVDPEWRTLAEFAGGFAVSVDAILAKKNLGTRRGEAGLVVGLGPGFSAGDDVDVVIETNRGHDLGRLITDGPAEANTGIPGNIAGYTSERVLRAPADGVVATVRSIGDPVRAGDVVLRVDGQKVVSALDGVVRGCIRDGTVVRRGLKLGDVDPRGERRYCFTVSEKARALGGSVLEAIVEYWHSSASGQ
ncbi:MAG: EF2563 family selenium-dependent molybdenum hydroxylase system protein [Planctomycetaceae bacterium]|nr:EF2563 family selenium-dependent molybdenum hydroxylase system protein [Planctomycetaceae bacterium]